MINGVDLGYDCTLILQVEVEGTVTPLVLHVSLVFPVQFNYVKVAIGVDC